MALNKTEGYYTATHDIVSSKECVSATSTEYLDKQIPQPLGVVPQAIYLATVQPEMRITAQPPTTTISSTEQAVSITRHHIEQPQYGVVHPADILSLDPHCKSCNCFQHLKPAAILLQHQHKDMSNQQLNLAMPTSYADAQFTHPSVPVTASLGLQPSVFQNTAAPTSPILTSTSIASPFTQLRFNIDSILHNPELTAQPAFQEFGGYELAPHIPPISTMQRPLSPRPDGWMSNQNPQVTSSSGHISNIQKTTDLGTPAIDFRPIWPFTRKLVQELDITGKKDPVKIYQVLQKVLSAFPEYPRTEAVKSKICCLIANQGVYNKRKRMRSSSKKTLPLQNHMAKPQLTTDNILATLETVSSVKKVTQYIEESFNERKCADWFNLKEDSIGLANNRRKNPAPQKCLDELSSSDLDLSDSNSMALYIETDCESIIL